MTNCQHTGPDQTEDFLSAFSLENGGKSSGVLSAIQYTVMCPALDGSGLNPPAMITRSWCCYEVSLSAFLDAFETTSHGRIYVNNLSLLYGDSVRVQDARSWLPSDKEHIDKIMLDTYGSYDAANAVISKAMIATLGKRGELAYGVNNSRLLENAHLWVLHFNSYMETVKAHANELCPDRIQRLVNVKNEKKGEDDGDIKKGNIDRLITVAENTSKSSHENNSFTNETENKNEKNEGDPEMQQIEKSPENVSDTKFNQRNDAKSSTCSIS